MPNFDGIYQIMMFYDNVIAGRTLFHKHTFDINLSDSNPSPGDPFTGINTTPRVSGSFPLDEYIESYAELVCALFGDTMSINRFELWKIPEGTFDGVFISGYTPTANTGTNAVACNPAQQTTLTFRSFAGGAARLQFMETSYTDHLRRPFPTSSAPANAIADFVLFEDSAFLARDNTPFLFALNLMNGHNEKIDNKRFRE